MGTQALWKSLFQCFSKGLSQCPLMSVENHTLTSLTLDQALRGHSSRPVSTTYWFMNGKYKTTSFLTHCTHISKEVTFSLASSLEDLGLIHLFHGEMERLSVLTFAENILFVDWILQWGHFSLGYLEWVMSSLLFWHSPWQRQISGCRCCFLLIDCRNLYSEWDKNHFFV